MCTYRSTLAEAVRLCQKPVFISTTTTVPELQTSSGSRVVMPSKLIRCTNQAWISLEKTSCCREIKGNSTQHKFSEKQHYMPTQTARAPFTWATWFTVFHVGRLGWALFVFFCVLLRVIQIWFSVRLGIFINIFIFLWSFFCRGNSGHDVSETQGIHLKSKVQLTTVCWHLLIHFNIISKDQNSFPKEIIIQVWNDIREFSLFTDKVYW